MIGIIATGVFSNYDKLFKDEIRAPYSGYRATGVFETEFRYFFDVSGTRIEHESSQQHLMNNIKLSLISKNPEDAEDIEAIMKVALEEAPSFDEVIKLMLPVYQKHFTVEELQVLNKFYSTEAMQNMIRKIPLLSQDLAPIQVKIFLGMQERLMKRIDEIRSEKFSSFVTRAYDSDAKSNLHNVFLACKSYWADTNPESDCTVDIVTQASYGYSQSTDVEVIINDWKENSFAATASHAQSENVYLMNSSGGISKQ